MRAGGKIIMAQWRNKENENNWEGNKWKNQD